ncbi:hypothetical protein QBC44DRAFT_379492 [Cladorrhinum sp. PSN332]|nr:hypothetical protein QBC44DRAFT_379492 [Cladorrhinum sp. PSN332]
MGFDDLPADILLVISDWIRECYRGEHHYYNPDYHRRDGSNHRAWFDDLVPLVKVNRKCNQVFTPVLFRAGLSKAVRWAVQSNDVHVLELALRFAHPKAPNPLTTVQRRFENSTEEYPLLSRGKLIPWWKVVGFESEIHDWRLHDRYGREDWSVTLLAIACASNSKEVVEFLLDGKGVDINAESQRFCNCVSLLQQLSFRRDQISNYNLRVSNNIRESLYGGQPPRWFPLHHSICGGNPAISILLLQRNASLRVTPDEDIAISALDCAVAHGQVEVVRFILERRSPAEHQVLHPPNPYRDRFSPAHYLALCHDRNAVLCIAKLLQGHGFGLGFSRTTSFLFFDYPHDRMDGSPLSIACFLGNFTAAKALLDAGASPHTDSRGPAYWNAIKLGLSAPFLNWTKERQTKKAWEEARAEFLVQAIRAGVQVNTWFPLSPLSIVIHNQFDAELKILIEEGNVNLDVQFADSHTPFTYLAWKARLTFLEMLLASISGAAFFTVYRQINKVPGPLQIERYLATLRIVLDHGAIFGLPIVPTNCNAGLARFPLLYESSLLHIACLQSNKVPPRHLLQALITLSDDWDFNAMTSSSLTPLMAVVRKITSGTVGAVRLLLSRGADPYLSSNNTAQTPAPTETAAPLQPQDPGSESSSDEVLVPLFLTKRISKCLHRLTPQHSNLSAFEHAILNGQTQAVKEFLKHKFPSDDDLERLGSEPARYLLAASSFETYDLLVLLLQLGLDPNLIGSETCVLSQIFSGMQAMLNDIRAFCLDARRIRQLFSRVGKALGAMVALIQHGANVNKFHLDDSFATILRKQLSERRATILQCILERTFSVEEDPTGEGRQIVRCHVEDTTAWFWEHDVSSSAVDWVCQCLQGVAMPFEDSTSIWQGLDESGNHTAISNWQQILDAVMELKKESMKTSVGFDWGYDPSSVDWDTHDQENPGTLG